MVFPPQLHKYLSDGGSENFWFPDTFSVHMRLTQTADHVFIFFFFFPFPNWWYKRCSGNLVLYPLNGVNVLLDPQPLGNGWGRDMDSVDTPKPDTDLFPLLRLSSYHSLCDVILLRLGGLMPRSDWKNVPHPAVIHAMTLLLRIEAFWVLFNSLFFLLRKKKL